ncbi:MAG: hypothetical protein F4Z29_07505 [Gemmatimonadetes bacterium]|nr:hypothetical protein [Gemmatimonadota bacterium]
MTVTSQQLRRVLTALKTGSGAGQNGHVHLADIGGGLAAMIHHPKRHRTSGVAWIGQPTTIDTTYPFQIGLLSRWLQHATTPDSELSLVEPVGDTRDAKLHTSTAGGGWVMSDTDRIPEEKHPDPPAGGFSVDIDLLVAVSAAAGGPDRPVLHGVHLERDNGVLHVEATDSYRLHHATTGTPSDWHDPTTGPWVVPQPLINRLARFAGLDWQITDTGTGSVIAWTSDGDVTWRFATDPAIKNTGYPKVRQLMDVATRPQRTTTVAASDIDRIIRWMTVLPANTAGRPPICLNLIIDGDDSPRLVVSDSANRISPMAVPTGSVATHTVDDPDSAVRNWFNLGYTLDALRYVNDGSDFIEIGWMADKSLASTFRTAGRSALLMPVRYGKDEQP